MDAMTHQALLVRQRTHLSASCSNRNSGSRNFFGSRHPKSCSRPRCQQQDQESERGHVKQKFEKYPDGPTQMDTPIEAYKRNIVAGKAFESVSYDSEDNLRG